MSGGGKGQTVGYWYHPTWEAVVCAGPVDALVRFDVADNMAWAGSQDESGTIAIDAPNLFGGESSEGGVQGSLAVRMGDVDQAALEDGQAHQGVLSLRWAGGRFGAMNPYPKAFSALVTRILAGWEHTPDGECWYPAAAAIALPDTGREYMADVQFDLASSAGDWALSNGGHTATIPAVAGTGVPTIAATKSRAPADGGRYYFEVKWHAPVGGYPDTVREEVGIGNPGSVSNPASTGCAYRFNGQVYRQGGGAAAATIAAPSANDIVSFAIDMVTGEVWIGANGTWYTGDPATGTTPTVTLTDLSHAFVPMVASESGVPSQTYTLYCGGAASPLNHAPPSGFAAWAADEVAGVAMNPAHLIYYTLVSATMQGEPAELVDDASFAAAADLFSTEGLGLCAVWDPDQETPEAFRARICDAAGAACSRSPVDGKWYLDPIRGAGSGLPTLTDDDILDIEIKPPTLDDATNQVSVTWFDPVSKQARTTAPIHALGAIDGAGINAETLDYQALPSEALALRRAESELRARATPIVAVNVTTTRKPYAWRRGTYFELAAPKHGIQSMKCLLGDIDRGTLASGAIKITALQDVYSLPATSYAQAQPAVITGPTVPVPVADGGVMEMPYAALVPELSAADLDYLADDAGYLLSYAARPLEGLHNYRLITRPSGGEYAEAGTFDWCPLATIVESASYAAVAFTFVGGVLLGRVALGTAALWGDEIVRVDALDTDAGTLTLGRGCWDTVPQQHTAGQRIFFFGGWHGGDTAEYTDGETVQAKLLPRSGTALLNAAEAAELEVEMASRAARPYPPAALQVNGGADPGILVGAIAVTWAHRDRKLQADQLVDTTEASVGPEAGTTYNAWLYDDATDAVIDSDTGISGTSWTPVLGSFSGLTRLEVESERDALMSWQRQVRRFFVGFLGAPRETNAGDERETNAGDARETT